MKFLDNRKRRIYLVIYVFFLFPAAAYTGTIAYNSLSHYQYYNEQYWEARENQRQAKSLEEKDKYGKERSIMNKKSIDYEDKLVKFGIATLLMLSLGLIVELFAFVFKWAIHGSREKSI